MRRKLEVTAQKTTHVREVSGEVGRKLGVEGHAHRLLCCTAGGGDGSACAQHRCHGKERISARYYAAKHKRGLHVGRVRYPAGS